MRFRVARQAASQVAAATTWLSENGGDDVANRLEDEIAEPRSSVADDRMTSRGRDEAVTQQLTLDVQVSARMVPSGQNALFGSGGGRHTGSIFSHSHAVGMASSGTRRHR